MSEDGVNRGGMSGGIGEGGMSESESPASLFRHVGAILAGLVVIILLSLVTDGVLNASGVFPKGGHAMSNRLLLVATFYRTIYSVMGCYLAAKLAPTRPMWHALALGFIGLVLSMAGAVATWNGGAAYAAKWYPLTLVAISLPTAWLGGKLAEMQLRNQSPGDGL